ncbi:hypothetical protein [Endothiovibrio diazotrophicus]
MSNMDEALERLQAFERVLDQFNQELRSSVDDLQQSHANVSPYWNDTMGREYYSRWSPLEQTMRQYYDVIVPNYVEVMQKKIHAIRAFLHG